MDLLSTLTHEFGHVLGLDHEVMGASLAVGVRDLATSQFRVKDELRRVFGDPEIGWRRFDETFELVLDDVSRSEDDRDSFRQRLLRSGTVRDQAFEGWHVAPIRRRMAHRFSLDSPSPTVGGEESTARHENWTMDEEVLDELVQGR
jgi:hypothetical protein